jgi:hypothetical protein
VRSGTLCRRRQQRGALRISEIHDAAVFLFEPDNLCRPGLDPLPLHGLVQEVRKDGEFPVDGRFGCAFGPPRPLISLYVRGLDLTQRLAAEKWA